MRDAALEALDRTGSVEDDFTRRRQARAWINAGRAALGAGDDALADAIAAIITNDVRPSRDGVVAGGTDHLHDAGFMAGHPVDYPELRDTHSQPDVIAAFQAMLLEHRRDVADEEGPVVKGTTY